jgi:DNA-binding LytR/AlgR family response regulator
MPKNKIRCLVTDDEPLAIEVLKTFILSVPSLELVDTCSDAMETMTALQEHHIDLLFLDIEMPQISGTDLVRTLKNPPVIIFTTAHREFALEGFELNALDYLLKPITFNRFLKAVNKLFPGSSENNSMSKTADGLFNHLYIRCDRKMVKIDTGEILFIESLKDYVKIQTTSKSLITKQLISVLSQNLPQQHFLRIHKSFIVATDKIDSYTADTIQIGNYHLPIGRLYKYEVNRRLSASSI